MCVVVSARVVVVADGEVDGEGAAGAGEGDVEQAALFFEFAGAGEGHVGGEVAVAGGDDVDGVPFESFGGVDGGEGEIVVVEVGVFGVVGC